jgi:glucosamine-6-phosphate isomerase
MKISIHADYEAMSAACARLIAEQVGKRPDSLLCVAAGDTPLGTFRQLIWVAQGGEPDFSRCRFVGLDEWLGMDRHDAGSCKQAVYQELLDPLGVGPDRIAFFDAKSPTPEQECARLDRYLDQHGPIDLFLSGIGVNGHLGLNEPGSPAGARSRVVELHPTTKKVGQKYFAGGAPLERGITLGLKDLLAARTVILLANGENKADIIRRSLQGEITEQVPASLLQRHPDCRVLLDAPAAARLDPR